MFRGSHYGHFHIRGNAHGDHSLPYLWPQPDARIKPLSDDVNEATFVYQLQPDIRVTLFKNSELWQQAFVDGVLAGINAYRTGRRLAVVRQRRQTRIKRIKRRLGSLIELLPGVG